MRGVTLNDLVLVLKDLFGPRLALWENTQGGRLYRKRLADLLAKAEALPDPAQDAPLAEELEASDLDFDGYAVAIHDYLGVFVDAAWLDESIRASARSLRDAFAPALTLVRKPYIEEAQWAEACARRLPELRAQLGAFPLPGGNTLEDWVSAFLESGASIGRLLDERAKIHAAGGPEGRKAARTLRMEMIGALRKLRQAMADEVELNEELPRNLVEQALGLYFEIQRMREAQGSKPKAGGEGQADAPA